MAVIQIKNLEVLGSDLFNDSETFINDLSEYEVSSINGGLTWTVLWFVGGGIVGGGLSFGATWLAQKMGW